MTEAAPKESKMVDYDPAEHRIKHCWSEPKADFVTTGVGIIGKCPSTLSKVQARELLNDAELSELCSKKRKCKATEESFKIG